jgi:hypothetical protein
MMNLVQMLRSLRERLYIAATSTPNSAGSLLPPQQPALLRPIRVPDGHCDSLGRRIPAILVIMAAGTSRVEWAGLVIPKMSRHPRTAALAIPRTNSRRKDPHGAGRVSFAIPQPADCRSPALCAPHGISPRGTVRVDQVLRNGSIGLGRAQALEAEHGEDARSSLRSRWTS